MWTGHLLCREVGGPSPPALCPLPSALCHGRASMTKAGGGMELIRWVEAMAWLGMRRRQGQGRLCLFSSSLFLLDPELIQLSSPSASSQGLLAPPPRWWSELPYCVHVIAGIHSISTASFAQQAATWSPSYLKLCQSPGFSTFSPCLTEM